MLYYLKVSIGATGKSNRDIPVDLRRRVSVSSRRKSETVIWRIVFVDESEATEQVRTRSYFPRCTRAGPRHRVFLRCNFRVNKSASDTRSRPARPPGAAEISIRENHWRNAAADSARVNNFNVGRKILAMEKHARFRVGCTKQNIAKEHLKWKL